MHTDCKIFIEIQDLCVMFRKDQAVKNIIAYTGSKDYLR